MFGTEFRVKHQPQCKKFTFEIGWEGWKLQLDCNLQNYADCRSRAERELLGHAERETVSGLGVQDFSCAERGKFNPR